MVATCQLLINVKCRLTYINDYCCSGIFRSICLLLENIIFSNNANCGYNTSVKQQNINYVIGIELINVAVTKILASYHLAHTLDHTALQHLPMSHYSALLHLIG